MKILKPYENDPVKFSSLAEDYMKNAIFLAGPCPRKNYDDDWRFDAFDILEKLNFDGTVITPTNDHYVEMKDVNDNMLMKQTQWEFEAMHKATAIVFWIPRSEEHPAFTTNLELGQWWGKPGVYVGFPDDSWKNEYIDCRLEMMKQKRYKSLEEMLKAVVTDLDSPAQTWFTSDTHFGAERTLELSKRPFVDTFNMDMALISNWNKLVHKNDTVCFLGDFGEFDTLKVLNFKKMQFVYGNYETRDLDNAIKELEKYENIERYSNDDLVYVSPKKNGYILRHEPLNPEKEHFKKNAFYAFGHIHGRDQYKRNGIDVGMDANNYCPISSDTLDWMYDAVIKFVDENVFTDVCK